MHVLLLPPRQLAGDRGTFSEPDTWGYAYIKPVLPGPRFWGWGSPIKCPATDGCGPAFTVRIDAAATQEG